MTHAGFMMQLRQVSYITEGNSNTDAEACLGAYRADSEAKGGQACQGGRWEPVGGNDPDSLRKAAICGADHIVSANSQRCRICCINDLHLNNAQEGSCSPSPSQQPAWSQAAGKPKVTHPPGHGCV